MTDMPNFRRHAALVDEMAGALGVDLEEAALRGKLDLDEISDAVLRCTGCTNPDHCQGVLATKPQLEQAPGYCRNRDLMHRLAAD
ncbi:DUF6455 family protein [Seohaeicola zhoushanensis]|nr:DUF6455 family protein [Seohaeicola zhoushanensis]